MTERNVLLGELMRRFMFAFVCLSAVACFDDPPPESFDQASGSASDRARAMPSGGKSSTASRGEATKAAAPDPSDFGVDPDIVGDWIAHNVLPEPGCSVRWSFSPDARFLRQRFCPGDAGRFNVDTVSGDFQAEDGELSITGNVSTCELPGDRTAHGTYQLTDGGDLGLRFSNMNASAILKPLTPSGDERAMLADETVEVCFEPDGKVSLRTFQAASGVSAPAERSPRLPLLCEDTGASLACEVFARRVCAYYESECWEHGDEFESCVAGACEQLTGGDCLLPLGQLARGEKVPVCP